METKIVAGVIVGNQNEVLLTSRPGNKILSGYFEFPGGKIEQGEEVENALIREMNEELGIKLVNYSFITEFSHSYTHAYINLKVFMIHAYSGIITPKENQQLYWQNLNQECNKAMLILPTTYIILDILREKNL
jgi:8-oxo-dGTP diphosphatase